MKNGTFAGGYCRANDTGRERNSALSAIRYAGRAHHPVVMVVDLDDEFAIPPSGGNDGVDGTFALSLKIDGELHQLRNLDVGCITRGSKPGRMIGLIADDVPQRNIRKLIASQGLPKWAAPNQLLTERSKVEMLALYRWTYKEVLEALVEKL